MTGVYTLQYTPPPPTGETIKRVKYQFHGRGKIFFRSVFVSSIFGLKSRVYPLQTQVGTVFSKIKYSVTLMADCLSDVGKFRNQTFPPT